MFKILILMALLAGVYALWKKQGQTTTLSVRHVAAAALLAVMATLALTPGSGVMAQTATPGFEFNIDISPVFQSILSYLPTFLGLFGVIGGIGIAVALARFIINAIRQSFTGKDV